MFNEYKPECGWQEWNRRRRKNPPMTAGEIAASVTLTGMLLAAYWLVALLETAI